MQQRTVTLLEALTATIVVFSLVSLALVLFGLYSSPRAALLSALGLASAWAAYRPRLVGAVDSRHGVRLLLLLLLALLFRFGPYHWIMGGQDQGTYVNMAYNLERNGSLRGVDRTRADISDPDILALYDAANRHSEMDQPIPGRYEGRYVLGVYIEDVDESGTIFQFYPLHPVWMAAFESAFGVGGGVWSVVFFGLLSIAAIYLLAFELTGSVRAAVLAGGLMAINPLHAYFSKYPVAEIQFLALELLAMLFTVRAWQAARENGRSLWNGLLAAGLWGCLFATRAHGFLYMPAVFAVYLAAAAQAGRSDLPPAEARAAKVAARLMLAVTGLYGLSLAYGFAVSFPYVYVVHGFAVNKVFGAYWPYAIAGALGLMAVLGLFVMTGAGRSVVLRAVPLARRLVPALTLGLLLFGLYKVWIFAFTEELAWGWVHEKWNVAGLGIVSTGHTLPGSIAMYLSPLVFGAFLLSLVRWRPGRPGLDAVRLLLLVFWCYAVFYRFLIPYHFYFARYYLSELVPLSGLLACVFLDAWLDRGGVRRKLALLTLAVGVVWLVPFSTAQMAGREGRGTYEVLARVADHVDRDDLLMLDREGFEFYHQVKPPLVYVFDRKVFDYEDDEVRDRVLREYAVAECADVYVLSCREQKAPFLSLEDEFVYRQELMEQGFRIPVLFATEKRKMYLYRVQKRWFEGSLVAKRILLEELPAEKVQGFYHDRKWTDGEGRITALDFNVPEGRTQLVLKTYGHNPNRNDIGAVQPEVIADGTPLAFAGQEGNDYIFDLAPEVGRIDSMVFRSKTFNPKVMGLNNDTRDLGLDIRAVEFR